MKKQLLATLFGLFLMAGTSSAQAPEKIDFTTQGWNDGDSLLIRTVKAVSCEVSFTENGGAYGGPVYGSKMANSVCLSANNAIVIKANEGSSIVKVVYCYPSSSQNRPRTKTNTDGSVDVNYTITEGNYVEKDENTDGVWTGEATTVSLAKRSGKGFLALSAVTVYYKAGTADNVVTLQESAANVIQLATGVTVKLDREPLVKGEWNTLCVPFAISAEMIAARGGADIRLFDHITDEKYMTSTTDHIDAGVPCLIKPYKDFDLTFEQVDITVTKPTTVSKRWNGTDFKFVGVFDPTVMLTDGSEQFLGASNYIYVPAEETKVIKGMRAFFRLPNTTVGAKIGLDDIVTGIDELNIDGRSAKAGDRIYDLQGRQVGTAGACNLKKGIYVLNGRKFVVR
ncbi:MAG: hypothetical protein MSD82_05975 [Prevotella sp.]|nr:hypothetical protein [Prevotella sp.]